MSSSSAKPEMERRQIYMYTIKSQPTASETFIISIVAHFRLVLFTKVNVCLGVMYVSLYV
jgi:hypothetical protein